MSIALIPAILALLSFFLVIYAAICNAKMDTVKDHYSTSIYSDKTKYNPIWFNPEMSWENKQIQNDIHATEVKQLQLQNLPWYLQWLVKFKPGWDPISDFWHWQKAKMLMSLFTAATLALFIVDDNILQLRMVVATVYFLALGFLWIGFFNEYYNHKLKKQ